MSDPGGEYLKLLIIGGTMFVGRHLVEAALAQGHEVTLFNRGQHNPDLFPEVEKLRGNRDSELDALKGRTWDVVVDTCGYVPRIVRQSAELLADSVGLYVFISTISVYSDYSQVGMDENAPLGTLEDPTVEEVTGPNYGPLKVLCEQAVEEALPGRALIIRPGFIIGPHDPSDRFTYWPYRVSQGGTMLAPNPPSQPMQFIDARDLAEWTLHLAKKKVTGIYNATGPDAPVKLETLLDESKAVTGADTEFVWADEAFLVEEKAPFPLWIPTGGNPELVALMQVSVEKAIADGLTFRSLAQTIQETLDWAKSRPSDYQWRTGLTPEREQELLQKWDEEKVTQG